MWNQSDSATSVWAVWVQFIFRYFRFGPFNMFCILNSAFFRQSFGFEEFPVCPVWAFFSFFESCACLGTHFNLVHGSISIGM